MIGRSHICRRLLLIAIIVMMATPKSLLASCCCERSLSQVAAGSEKKLPPCCAKKAVAVPSCCQSRQEKQPKSGKDRQEETLSRVCTCEKSQPEAIPAVVRADRPVDLATLYDLAFSTPVAEVATHGPAFRGSVESISDYISPPFRVLECCWRE